MRQTTITQLFFWTGLLVFLTVCNAQPSDTPAGEIPASFFGMTLINSAHWPTVPVGALGKGTAVSWIYIESSRGKYDWSNLDRWAELAQSHGITLFWSNSGVPTWAAADRNTCAPSYPGSSVQRCTSMIIDIRDWDAFITALATRYKGKLIYELWNEPEQKNSWTGSVADLVMMSSHMHNIVRAIDPGTLIIAPSGSAVYMDRYYAAGGVRTVDVVSVHGYPDPRRNDVAETISGFLTVPMRAVLAKYGLSQKPLWDTEGSWGNARSGAIADPDLQAAFVARDYLLHWSNGITRFYWYAWDGETWGALWDRAKGSHSAAAAYQQVYSWMVGAKMVGLCSTNGGTIYDAIYTCDLVRGGGYLARAVWNTSGDTKFIVPPAYTQYRDLDGHVHAVPPDRSITIGQAPILLEHPR